MGCGNDLYIVDNSADVVIEHADAGHDIVRASASFVLGEHIEDLELTGSAAIDATGNAMQNTLRGNAGANRLDGGGGNDLLVGGAGNDTYLLRRGYGCTSVYENDLTPGNTDVAQFASDIAADQLWFRKVGTNLEVACHRNQRPAEHQRLVQRSRIPPGTIPVQRRQDLAGQPGAEPGRRDGGLRPATDGADPPVGALCESAGDGNCGELAMTLAARL